MAQFESMDEAKYKLNEALIEINEILQRDLADTPQQTRTVDLWFQVYGKNRSFDLTKEKLRDLEMIAIDCEIFILDEKVRKNSLADTFS